MTSLSSWIPLLWVIIIGTRSVSSWFLDTSLQEITIDDYLEGSPFDRNVYIALLLAGCAIFLSRLRSLNAFFKTNKWFFTFLIFCGVSCLWSDYSFVSFKRYIKDIGTVMMALIIMTETKPEQSLKSILSRYTYITIPLSVLFIIYFPEYGRYYEQGGSYAPVYCGIATNKNALGQISFICGIFMVWDYFTTRHRKDKLQNRLDSLLRMALLAMVIWLLHMANSSTSTVCMMIGSLIIILLNTSFGKRKIHHLGTGTLVILFFIIMILTIPDLFKSITNVLGRDATLTGRTDIWKALLAQPINPLLGSGYQSFWQTPAAVKIGEKFYFIVNQAHNGYLEVYIQTGIISLLLLICAVVLAVKNLKKGLLEESDYALLLFSFLITILIRNWTEATFNKLTISWFIFILSLLYNNNFQQQYNQAKNKTYESDAHK